MSIRRRMGCWKARLGRNPFEANFGAAEVVGSEKDGEDEVIEVEV